MSTIMMLNKDLKRRVDELLELLDKNPSSKANITGKTAKIVDVLYNTRDIEKTMAADPKMDDRKLNGHILKAIRMLTSEQGENLKFGSFVLELFELIEKDPSWEQYVGVKTAKVVKTVYQTMSMNDSEKILDMKYTTIRAHLLKAVERIEDKKTDFKRGGGGAQAQELFDLMDSIENWKEFVTDHEIELAESFKKVKNFYEVARLFNLQPGNIAGTLYGTTQKIGVIGKIKQRIPQVNRRDIDGRREEA